VFEELLRDWDGEEVALRYDAGHDAWMFVCVHSTVLGPGAGGTRMKVYPSPADALGDGLRLSGAMTSKNAVAGLPFGGGKAVLAVRDIPTGPRREDLLLRYADLVESLHGTYWTACDMNTTPDDMDVIGRRCSSVVGRTEAAGGSGSSAPATADGVYEAIVASLEHVFGSPDLAGRSVVVQGVGAVGHVLARRLGEAGAKVSVADVDPSRAEAVAAEVGATPIPAGDAISTVCDVFSPCATGGVLSADGIAALRCRIVAGAANNQLQSPEDGELFTGRGILYAPDYVVNAGGMIHLASLEILREDIAKRDERIRGIADTLREVFRRSEADGVSTSAAAEAMVRERLAAA
jgi:glutamate dehydrogenase/leucine dehydrogenase